MPSSENMIKNVPEKKSYLVDTHCHFDFEIFDKDREQVLQRAKDNHITDIIIPGTQKKYWDRINHLCASNKEKINRADIKRRGIKRRNIKLHACYGLHPYWTEWHQLQDIETLEKYLAKNESVALGECGLDFRPQHINNKNSVKKIQTEFFEAQLDIAKNLQLPVVIHSVNATEDVIQSIKKFKNLTGMIHSYSGSTEQAKQLIDLNFLISIGGSVTYDQAKKIKKVVSGIPLSSLLVETDAPDQTDQHNQKKRNEPAFLINTVKEISRLRNETEQSIAEQTTINARRLFKI
jgi:TatD DNase family protein